MISTEIKEIKGCISITQILKVMIDKKKTTQKQPLKCRLEA